MAKSLAEGDVVASREPGDDQSPDSWPELRLSNVHVHKPDDPQSPCSLLLASEHYPLTVTGILAPLDPRNADHARIYLQPNRERCAIEITNVTTFSYGQYDDGSIQIWAAGQAGWYAITPARGFRAIHDKMMEDVKALYFVADSYKEVRKAGKGKNVVTLPPYSPQELFTKYADEMMSGSTDADSAAEYFYKHRDFLLTSMIQGKEGMYWSQIPLFRHFIRKFPDEYAAVKKRVLGPNPRASEAPSMRTERSDSAGAVSFSSSRRRAGRPIKSEPVRSNGASIDSALQSKEPSIGVKSRSGKRGLRSSSLESTGPESGDVRPGMDDDNAKDETESSDSSASQIPARARSGKSILRPRSTKAGKGAAASKKQKSSSPSPKVRDGADSARSPTAGKRKLEDLDGEPSLAKRRNSRTDGEAIDMPISPSTSEGHSGTAHAIDTLPLESLNHQPDPVQEDTWICALDGCTHKVFAASQPDSQRLIREHYALHAYDDDERVQMVKKLQAPSLPVSHLMERVRQQAKTEGFPGSKVAGTRFPGTFPTVRVVQRY